MEDCGAAGTRERTRSLSRLARDRLAVNSSLDSKAVAVASRNVTHPANFKGTLRKAGIAMALAPEPVTTVAGVAMVGASFVMKGREPASIETLRVETVKALSGIKGLRTDLDQLSL